MKEIKLLSRICNFIIVQSNLYIERQRIEYLKKFNLDGNLITKNVQIHQIQNISVGKGTFYNSGQLFAGPNSKIIIGENCAIGYNVHIKSYTHNAIEPTGINTKMVDKDINIGHNVWIGDNVYIKEGITIESNVVIGANSVVTKSVEKDSVVGGCPSRLLYKKSM